VQAKDPNRRHVLGDLVSVLPPFQTGVREARRIAPCTFAAVYLDDEENPLWEDYAVEVVPTLALFRGGKLVDRLDGILGYGIDRKMVDDFVNRLQPELA